MKTQFIVFSTLVTLLATLSSPNSSNANNHDALKDSNGNFIRSSAEDCVRTIFPTDSDPCEVGKKIKEDVVTKIMMMEERIVHFDFDKHELTSEAQDKLMVLSDVLTKHNITAIKIVGYTDKIGSDEYNYKLSERRANTANEFINSLVKLDRSIVELRGLGKSNFVKECPDIKNKAELIKCLAPNRRVDIEVDYYDYKRS